jgi:hypothetical protein
MSIPSLKIAAAAAVLAFSACLASAQTTAPAPTAPAATDTKKAATPKKAPAKKAAVPKKATTPAGIKCSADADAKGLHGKERRKFRATCIRAFKKDEAAKKKG